MIGLGWSLCRILALSFVFNALAFSGYAQQGLISNDLSALARFEAEHSRVKIQKGQIFLNLAISQAVPWRVRVMDQPPRLVIDTKEVDWAELSSLPKGPDIPAMRAGVIRRGWSRLVVRLPGAYLIDSAEMVTFQTPPSIRVSLSPATPDAFKKEASLPEPVEWALTYPIARAERLSRGKKPKNVFKVVIDPGHGGFDPGAESLGYEEASLMLTFARELKELLMRSGNFDVILTRDEDIFVPLDERISIAQHFEADVFLSLHADALLEGEARGISIYTLSKSANSEASRLLAEQHDRDDLLVGVDLSYQDDVVALALMDMVRAETTPKTERLANQMKSSILSSGLRMHPKALQQADFSVLKSPVVPSLLIELGFLSSSGDLQNIIDSGWRHKVAVALEKGLKAWYNEERLLDDIGR